ncbi:MAG: SPOR domain-containing protein [Alphaproteobacteria bacterium]|nr:SPOR domain-containing protein [Alphaproteobacteria bacterium]
MTFSPNDDDRLWQDSKSEGWFRFSSPVRYIFFLLILIILVVGAWYLLTPGRQDYNEKNMPLIRADDTPYKIKAEDQTLPGIKHQDKLIYSRIRNDENAPPVEHILPDPEPILIDAQTDSSPMKMENLYSPEDIQLEKVQEKTPETKENVALSIASIEELIEGNSEEVSEGVSKKVSEETPSPQSKARQSNVLIQLGSLKSHDLAQEEWKRISGKNKDALGGLEPLIQKVDLGAEKGIFYRLRTGVETQEQAKKVCATLIERKVECLVIH